MIFMILYIMVGIFVVGAGGYNVQTRRQLGCSPSQKRQLSEPSRRILKMYRDLPKVAREIDDLPEMLAALDFKHGIKSVNSEFENYDGVFSWRCRHYNGGCIHEEYIAIKTGVTNIADALEQREKAAALVARSAELENAGSLAERLNSEATAIQNSIKGLK